MLEVACCRYCLIIWRTNIKLYALVLQLQQGELHKWFSTRISSWTASVLYVHKRFNRRFEIYRIFIFADDLKILAVNSTHLEIQTDLTALNKWAAENKMSFFYDKCAKRQLRGTKLELSLIILTLSSKKNIKDLGVILMSDLTWNSHFEQRL